MCYRIREAMKTEDTPSLAGTAEVDETYVGGKAKGADRGGRGNFRSKKAVVIAALQRGGDIRIKAGKTNTKAVLHGFINEVAPNADRIITDEWPG